MNLLHNYWLVLNLKWLFCSNVFLSTNLITSQEAFLNNPRLKITDLFHNLLEKSYTPLNIIFHNILLTLFIIVELNLERLSCYLTKILFTSQSVFMNIPSSKVLDQFQDVLGKCDSPNNINILLHILFLTYYIITDWF